MIYQEHIFLDEHSNILISEPISNTHATELILEIKGDSVDVEVFGTIRNDYYSLTTVNIKDLNVTTEIKSSGIYIVPINGINKIKIENKGDINSVRVYGKLVD